jgi:TRAP-type C4-dicarboxylate transport system permease small subunit
MDFFVRIVKALSIASGLLAAAAVMAAVVVVCEMVVIRYFLDSSTIWQTEFVTFSIVGATLIGSPYVLLTKGHVNVDLLPHYLSHRNRIILAMIASIMGLTFCVVLAWTGWRYLFEAIEGGWRTDTVWSLPLWIPISPLPVGMTLLALQYVADILCVITGRELPFGMKPEEGS